MSGVLYGIGVGPGDPELLTFKAARLIRACPVVAYPANLAGESQARGIAEAHLGWQREIVVALPFSRQRESTLAAYDAAAAEIADALKAGEDVALLCEGDPLLFGSFIYFHERLGEQFPCVIVPGISSVMAAAAAARQPLTRLDQSLRILPASCGVERLRQALAEPDALAILKPGRQYGLILELLRKSGRWSTSSYIEYASRAGERVVHNLDELPQEEQGPYFALFLVEAKQC